MERRKAHSSRLLEGMGRVDAWLDAVGWTTFDGVLRRIEKELFEADWAAAKAEYGADVSLDQLPRTPEQRRADAMVEMAVRAAAVPAGAKRPLPVVVIHMDSKTFERGIDRELDVGDDDEPYDSDMLCELADGTPITPDMAVKAALRGHAQRAVYDSPAVILNYGRSVRFATGTLRDVIKTRDRTCTGPEPRPLPMTAKSTTSSNGNTAATPAPTTATSNADGTTAGNTSTPSPNTPKPANRTGASKPNRYHASRGRPQSNPAALSRTPKPVCEPGWAEQSRPGFLASTPRSSGQPSLQRTVGTKRARPSSGCPGAARDRRRVNANRSRASGGHRESCQPRH
jgi:hypothetical protein